MARRYGIVNLLSDRTKNELNVDLESLNPASQKKVYVQCSRCEEVFLREYKALNNYHACRTRAIIDNIDHKWCSNCDLFHPTTDFDRNAAIPGGLVSRCKHCNNTQRKIRYSTDYAYWLKYIVANKQNKCIKEGVPCDIDLAYMSGQWERQNGRCYYSNLKLSFGTRSLDSAWMERVDPTLGYVKGNVVWAAKGLNCLKSDSTEPEFRKFLAEILADHTIARVRAEYRMVHDGAKLPFRKRTTDAGHDLHSIEEVILHPGESRNVCTGIQVSVPEGWYYNIEGRSSMWLNKIITFSGTVDATYCDTIYVGLYNIGTMPYHIKPGDRIAQMILRRVYDLDLVEVDEFSPDYNLRGVDGWGSSGK